MSVLATLAAVYGGTAVVLGAFGAHGLKKRIADPQRIQVSTRISYPTAFTSSPRDPSRTCLSSSQASASELVLF
jgi:hypothetical protein